MSLRGGLTSVAMSVSDADKKIKKELFDCLGLKDCSFDDDMFDSIDFLPDSLAKFYGITFIQSDHDLRHQETDLFLLANCLFGETYLLIPGEWSYDENYPIEDQEKEENPWDLSGEIHGECEVRLYIPDGFVKWTFELLFNEVLDCGGGSSGGFVEFNTAYGIGEDFIDEEPPDNSFVEEILYTAKEKGYTDLASLIIAKCS